METEGGVKFKIGQKDYQLSSHFLLIALAIVLGLLLWKLVIMAALIYGLYYIAKQKKKR